MTDVRRERPLFTSALHEDERLRASFERLAASDYASDSIIAETLTSDWPGDAAGRLLLSLSRFARAGLPSQDHATELVELMLLEMADHGYFGSALGDVVDEQQVACHGWVVSGLLQYHYVTGDERARRAALRAVDELILPALGRLDTYPLERDLDTGIGGASGTATTEVNGWRLSSDVWCVLLTLNALVPSYLETSRADIRAMIDRIAGVLQTLDLVAQKAQLHASLSAALGLSEIALAEADERLMGIASKIYDDYVGHGRALNYAPFNWFDREDSWSESCAIVDSLGLAQNLSVATGLDRYTIDAQRIEHNALSFAERRDGSFGVDSLATPQSPLLTPIHYDARWCCTMRGAIGLLEVRETSVTVDHGKAIVGLSGFHSGTMDLPLGGRCVVREDADSLGEGRVGIEVIDAPDASAYLELQVPSGFEETLRLKLGADSGGVRELRVPSQISVETLPGGSEVRFEGQVLQVQCVLEGLPTGDLRPLNEVAGTFGADDWPVLLLATPAPKEP